MSTQRGIIEILEDFLKQSKILYINDQPFIYKQYSREHGLVKWFFIKAANLFVQAYPFTLEPKNRMIRETTFMEDNAKPIKTPRIIVKDWISTSVVREYLEGTHFNPYFDRDEYYVLGEVIAKIHSYGYVMGDTKYTNFLKIHSQYYVIDAEQAIRTNSYNYMYWDIFVFLTTTMYRVMTDNPLKGTDIIYDRINSFLNGYVSSIEYDYHAILSNVNKLNYKAIIYVLLPYPYNMLFIKAIKQLIGV